VEFKGNLKVPGHQYGLGIDKAGAVLKQQLKDLTDLLMGKQPNIKRVRAGWSGPYGKKSVGKYRQTILQYMGFQHLQYGTHPNQLILETFGNLDSLFNWFGFLLYQRQIKPGQVAEAMTNSKKILAYLDERGKAEWVGMLTKEMIKLGKLQKGGQVLPGDQPVMALPDGEALLAWCKADFLPGVLAEAQQEVNLYNDLNHKTAVMVKDAVLFSCLFGEFGTHRVAHLCSAKAPQFSQGACTHELCTLGDSCQGNNFEFDEGTQQFRFKCPHHKNQSKGQQAPNIGIRDETLNSLFFLYVKYARPVLAAFNEAEQLENMFLTNRGHAYQPPTVSNWLSDEFFSK
jgi:hypothetical protein